MVDPCYDRAMKNTSKLVVLRGPSGAGKSTVAKILHERTAKKTALVEQDYFRHGMLNLPHTNLEVARHIQFACIRSALEQGCDVITEGIMSMGKYKKFFDELLRTHTTENYFFYFDVSFDETTRRHETRAKSEHFTAEEMHEWYDRAAPSGYPNEHSIPEDYSAEQALELIVRVAHMDIQQTPSQS
jgi:adenylate kinase family enzyme